MENLVWLSIIIIRNLSNRTKNISYNERPTIKESKLEDEILMASPSIRVQAGRVLAATMAAFIATKLAEGVYDTLIKKHYEKTTANSVQ